MRQFYHDSLDLKLENIAETLTSKSDLQLLHVLTLL